MSALGYGSNRILNLHRYRGVCHDNCRANISGRRPALLRPDDARQLEEFSSFRHLVRNIYVDGVDPSHVKQMFVSVEELGQEGWKTYL